MCELSADKCSGKMGSKLLFGFARPPTQQYNRWVECVIKIVAGGFPGLKKKANGKTRRKEEGGRRGGGCSFLSSGKERGGLPKHHQATFMIPTDAEGSDFYWV